MKSDPDYDRLMARAVKLLSMKALTVADLRERLLQCTHDESVVARVIGRLEELRYLDDSQYASDFCSSRLNLKPVGRRRLRWDLARKKVPEAIIEQTLNKTYESLSEDVLVDRAIQKHMCARGRPRTPAEKKRLYQHLLRLGFDHDLVVRKISGHSRSDPEEGGEGTTDT